MTLPVFGSEPFWSDPDSINYPDPFPDPDPTINVVKQERNIIR